MVERAGCTSGARGFGARKFKGQLYDVYKVYVSKQPSAIDHEAMEKFKQENVLSMQNDRDTLTGSGIKTKLVRKDCGQILVLYVLRKEPTTPS